MKVLAEFVSVDERVRIKAKGKRMFITCQKRDDVENQVLEVDIEYLWDALKNHLRSLDLKNSEDFGLIRRKVESLICDGVTHTLYLNNIETKFK